MTILIFFGRTVHDAYTYSTLRVFACLSS